MSRSLFKFLVYFLFNTGLSISSLSAKSVYFTDNGRLVLREDFDLKGDTLFIPNDTKLISKGGAIHNGVIVIGGNVTINGGNRKWNGVRLIAKNKSDIRVSSLKLNYEFGKSMSTALYFYGCSNIVLSDFEVNGFYHLYVKELESEDENGFKWYPLVFISCNRIKINDANLERTWPEGPFFLRCSDVRINKLVVDDKKLENKNIWTSLNLFYCTDVRITDSYFYKKLRGLYSGSSINFCCKNSSIKNCTIVGGKGIDLSNEWVDMSFDSKEVTISNCQLYDVYFGLYTEPTPGLVEDIDIKGCTITTSRNDPVHRIKSCGIFGYNLKRLSVTKCTIKSDIIYQTMGDVAHSGEWGNNTFKDCIFQSYSSNSLEKNNLVSIVNMISSDIDCGDIKFERCVFSYPFEEIKLFHETGGKGIIIVKNSRIRAMNTLELERRNNVDVEKRRNKYY